jgi:hypothetical protein
VPDIDPRVAYAGNLHGFAYHVPPTQVSELRFRARVQIRQHRLQRRHQRDWLFRKEKPIRQRAQNLALDKDGTATHPRNHHRAALGDGSAAHHNHYQRVAVQRILQHADHFHLEAFDLRALKHGQPVAAHARLELRHGEHIAQHGAHIGGVLRPREHRQPHKQSQQNPAHLVHTSSVGIRSGGTLGFLLLGVRRD